jgi:hypothetical protein
VDKGPEPSLDAKATAKLTPAGSADGTSSAGAMKPNKVKLEDAGRFALNQDFQHKLRKFRLPASHRKAVRHFWPGLGDRIPEVSLNKIVDARNAQLTGFLIETIKRLTLENTNSPLIRVFDIWKAVDAAFQKKGFRPTYDTVDARLGVLVREGTLQWGTDDSGEDDRNFIQFFDPQPAADTS